MIQSHFHPLGLQSHYFLSWVLESQAFKSFIGIQSHHLPSQAFKAIFSNFRRSGSFLSSVLGVQSHSSLPVLDVQSHHVSIVGHLEPSSSLVWRLELCLHFGIQSICPVQHSVPPSSFSFDVQSCCAYSFRHFESPSFLIFGFQNHFFFSALSFRVIALDIHIHWHCTSCLHDFTFVFIFLTSLPCAYRLLIMLFLDFPFHYT